MQTDEQILKKLDKISDKAQQGKITLKMLDEIDLIFKEIEKRRIKLKLGEKMRMNQFSHMIPVLRKVLMAREKKIMEAKNEKKP